MEQFKVFFQFFLSSLVWINICSIEVSLSRERKEEVFKPVNCSLYRSPYSTQNCHNSEKDCHGSCICKHGTTLIINEKRELECMKNVKAEKGCYYVFEEEERMKLLVSVSGTESSDSKVFIGLVKLRNGKRLSKCTSFEEKSTFWNVTKWSPLFTEGRRPSNLYFAEGRDILYMDRQKQKLYTGLLIKLAVRCDESTEEPNSKSCVMFKVLGYKKYKLPKTFIESFSRDEAMAKNSLDHKGLDNLHKAFIATIGICVIIIMVLVLYPYLSSKKRKSSKKSFNIYEVPIDANSNNLKHAHDSKALEEKDFCALKAPFASSIYAMPQKARRNENGNSESKDR